MCQPLFFIHLRQGKYSRRPEIYGRVESGLVYTALVLIPLWEEENGGEALSQKLVRFEGLAAPWHKLVLVGSDLSKLDQTCPNWIKLVLIG